MKKKAVEKIPFLKLPETVKKKAAEYAAVADVKEIDGEEHLFVEVYRNRKECRAVPAVRIVLTDKDFGTYFTESGSWSRERITKNDWSSYGLVWWGNDVRAGKPVNIMPEENVLYSQEDLKRIKDFVRVGVWDEEEWWEYIDQKQKDIARKERAERTERSRERREKALKQRKKNTPELPEERVLEYADGILFHRKHYLYYRKHGSRAAVACSKCGNVTEARWKPGVTLESQAERMMEEPKMGEYGVCPKCGAYGKFIPQGRAKNSYREEKNLFLGQKYKETGMVFRYITVMKEWNLKLSCTEKAIEMQSAGERLSEIETVRIYFEPGKKVQRDYCKHNPWSGIDFWDDCNLGGLNSIRTREAQIMPETYENMAGTFLEYSALEEYERAAGEVNAENYLVQYIQLPQIEMLVKLGLFHVAGELIRGRNSIVSDTEADRADTFLGIRKDRVKQLIKHQGDPSILCAMQMEKQTGQRFTDKQIKQLAEAGLMEQAGSLLEYMGVQKMLNQISRYAGCGYGTMCSTAAFRIEQTARRYVDYINMRKELGYDLQNTVYLFPKDLDAAHRRMVEEYSRTEADKRIRETEERFPLIKENYNKLKKRFYFKDKDFVIRPAASAEEIVMEGRILHHCVGGDDYLDRHNRGKNIILFLRAAGEQEVPYITVEIDAEHLRICQWYGAYDKKPDEERMQRWLDKYTTRLKTGTLAAGAGTRERNYA